MSFVGSLDSRNCGRKVDGSKPELFNTLVILKQEWIIKYRINSLMLILR